jgi:hypothetical protein
VGGILSLKNCRSSEQRQVKKKNESQAFPPGSWGSLPPTQTRAPLTTQRNIQTATTVLKLYQRGKKVLTVNNCKCALCETSLRKHDQGLKFSHPPLPFLATSPKKNKTSSTFAITAHKIYVMSQTNKSYKSLHTFLLLSNLFIFDVSHETKTLTTKSL